MTWVERLRRNLLPLIDSDQREERSRHARNGARLLIGLVGLSLVADVFFRIEGGIQETLEFTLDLASIVGLIGAAAGSLLLLRRQRILEAGYLMAGALFLLTSANLFRYPEALFLMAAVYPLCILLMGAVVGGLSGYPFAIAGTVVLAAGWLSLPSPAPLAAYLGDTSLGLGFVIGQLLLYFGAAVTTHALSRQAEEVRATLQEHTEKMTQLAHTDPLTGLANRRQLIDQLQREYGRARRYRRPLGLLYLDLDGFKAINDRFGHMFGDEVLRHVANTMRAVLRSADLLARIGGDEFAVLLPETPLSGSENVAAKLHRALTSYSQRLGPAVTPLTVCVGIAQLHEEDTSIDDVLTRADTALLLAKSVAAGSTRTEIHLPA
ncbi:MAG: GGDEF domain-containing protein [Chloroflexota bacterium]